jgi:hypothetical protein
MAAAASNSSSMSISTHWPLPLPATGYRRRHRLMAGRRRDAEFGTRQAVDPRWGLDGLCPAAVGVGQRSKTRRHGTTKVQKANKGQPDSRLARRRCLIAIGRLIQQLGAKAARPEQRECFEALAARQRSLFSAAMNAARGPDGVPDSPAPAAAPSPGMELAGALQRLRYRLASHQPPAHGSLGSEIQGARGDLLRGGVSVSGARNRRELAPGD